MEAVRQNDISLNYFKGVKLTKSITYMWIDSDRDS